MLNENIKAIRKSKGLSQQELAIKLNVVRQTISKWEQGLSVPDSDMLISLSEVLETPVSTLLGETVTEAEADNLKAISEKLEVINLQLAQRKTTRRKIIRWLLVSLCAIILRQHRTIAEASAVESPIRRETIGFPAHFFARAHNFKPPGRACQPEADSPMRT